jgi:3-keto-5-aminohexanoate cleavage enzyme
MDPLIITATPNISWLNPKVKYPKNPEEMAESAKRCAAAGASIIHIHAERMWAETIKALRKETKAIIQCGMSSLSIADRMEVFSEHADMISIILGHPDEAFVNVETNVLHNRKELIEYSDLVRQYKLKPEFEVWHTGNIWNLKYLIEGKYLNPPYFSTLFFGWPGGNWTPPTIEEYMYRKRYMPDKSVINVSVMGTEQKNIITAAILLGDHVRVGTEDNPFLGNKKATTEQLVGWVADIAKTIGRKVATVEEAKSIIGLKR